MAPVFPRRRRLMPAATSTVSETFATPPAQAFPLVLAAPLPRLFDRRHLALPPITGVREQAGDWSRVGATRTIVLAEGATMRERLVAVQEPRRLDDELTGLPGPLGLLVRRVEGRWAFDAASGGTRVTWTWRVHPHSALTVPAVLLLRVMWRGYARLGLERVGLVLARWIPGRPGNQRAAVR